MRATASLSALGFICASSEADTVSLEEDIERLESDRTQILDEKRERLNDDHVRPASANSLFLQCSTAARTYERPRQLVPNNRISSSLSLLTSFSHRQRDVSSTPVRDAISLCFNR